VLGFFFFKDLFNDQATVLIRYNITVFNFAERNRAQICLLVLKEYGCGFNDTTHLLKRGCVVCGTDHNNISA